MTRTITWAAPKGFTLASDTEAEAVGMLEAILEAASIYRESEALLSSAEAAAGEAALASRCAYKSGLARGVHTASRKVAGGLLASATYASNSISRGASYFTPAQPTATPVAISPGIKKRFAQTARLAGYASKAVNSAVSGLAYVGAKVAGGVLWVAGANKPLKPGEEAGTLREVGQAAVLGFTQVWDSMEEAGQTVLLSARDSTAGVMRQRYGPDAEEVSVHSMNAAGYTAEAAFSARKIGVKTVAKAAAKKTAKGVIHKWAGMDSSGAGGGSASSSRGGSRGGSRGSSADNLAAAAGAGPAEPAGVGVAAGAGGVKAKLA
ncbi:hypothetical protein COHA_007029 [Chlorella ohadii]|uniref:Senescence domain-containing protein n=1 Tax=Chlorella ohadii TaxID=2649997 RepID=A0AAD5DLN1_9CHLO|nr:hypothetical protein COHA_007029 [Chlorella ohadii]